MRNLGRHRGGGFRAAFDPSGLPFDIASAAFGIAACALRITMGARGFTPGAFDGAVGALGITSGTFRIAKSTLGLSPGAVRIAMCTLVMAPSAIGLALRQRAAALDALDFGFGLNFAHRFGGDQPIDLAAAFDLAVRRSGHDRHGPGRQDRACPRCSRRPSPP